MTDTLILESRGAKPIECQLMSIPRQRPLSLADERFLMIRTLCSHCAPGVRTTSPTEGWHRLIAAARGILLVRTPHGQWSAPARNAVWVPQGVRAEIETCVETDLRIFFLRDSRAAWNRQPVPRRSSVITVGALLRESLARVAEIGALDRRIEWHLALTGLLLHEIHAGAAEPLELPWPRDSRLARVAALVHAAPAGRRDLPDLCKGQGVSMRTVQRLFPQETGLTFEAWRTRVRLLHATRLLAEGRKVSEVAARCGYRSPSAFVIAFSRLTGLTPGKFRST